MKTKCPNLFGVLASLLVIGFSFLLVLPAPTHADGTVNANNPAVVTPAMLSSPSSANFALSPTTNGQIVESASVNLKNMLGAVAAIILIGLVLLVLLATLLSPFVPLFRHIMHKFLEVAGDTHREEGITHYHIHRAGQSLSTN